MKTDKKSLLLWGVLLSMLTIIPGALAALSGTAAVSGNPSATLDLSVTGSDSFDPMVVGTNMNTTSNSVTVTVVSNSDWGVTVHDALTASKPADTVGKMAEWDGTSAYVVDGYKLANAFEVGSDASTFVTLTGAPSNALYSSSIAGTTIKYPFFRQTVVDEDQYLKDAGHTYRMVVTFTAASV